VRGAVAGRASFGIEAAQCVAIAGGACSAIDQLIAMQKASVVACSRITAIKM
jgi:hypothetical protein